ncbi:MAG: hypothetical protein AVDCRST_MAG56-1770, partial [uncultured Cytophagales bacterium]
GAVCAGQHPAQVPAGPAAPPRTRLGLGGADCAGRRAGGPGGQRAAQPAVRGRVPAIPGPDGGPGGRDVVPDRNSQIHPLPQPVAAPPVQPDPQERPDPEVHSPDQLAAVRLLHQGPQRDRPQQGDALHPAQRRYPSHQDRDGGEGRSRGAQEPGHGHRGARPGLPELRSRLRGAQRRVRPRADRQAVIGVEHSQELHVHRLAQRPLPVPGLRAGRRPPDHL